MMKKFNYKKAFIISICVLLAVITGFIAYPKIKTQIIIHKLNVASEKMEEATEIINVYAEYLEYYYLSSQKILSDYERRCFDDVTIELIDFYDIDVSDYPSFVEAESFFEVINSRHENYKKEVAPYIEYISDMHSKYS